MRTIRYYTHIATSLAGTMIVAPYLDESLSIPLITGTIVGSLIPDIDEPKSFLGRRSLGISWLIKKKYGHRGGTHSLIIWFILMAVLLTLQKNAFTLGISLGYFFHIMGDFFSTKGVPLLLPFSSKRFKFFVTYRTGGWLEKFILCLAITYCTMTLYHGIRNGIVSIFN